MEHYTEFLPISRADMEARGWEQLDFVVVGGDAYVDHPSFGTAIISRLLEAEGYKVGVLAQPRYSDCEDFKRFGKPKYGFFIGGGNVDSMVSHYSVAKIPRAEDEYSPGGKGGARPDRSATVYTRLAKQAYPDLPVILGGLEASLRRFAHYDYWLDTVLPSIAEDSGADIISFGMGEHQTVAIARRLAAGEPVESITDVDGTCYMTDFDHLPERYVECAGFKKVASDKVAYAKACRIQMDNQDVVSGNIIVQKQSEKYLVQNIPAKPLVRWELDKVYALPYTRRYHPIYEAMIEAMEKHAIQDGKKGSGSADSDEEGGSDPMLKQAVEVVIDAGQASTSLLQRRCKLGYARAARIMDEMEEKGIIGPYEGAKPRAVLISRQQWLEMQMNQPEE